LPRFAQDKRNIDPDFPADQWLEASQFDSKIGQWSKIKKDMGKEKFVQFYNGVLDRGENVIEARKRQSSGTTSKRARTDAVATTSSSSGGSSGGSSSGSSSNSNSNSSSSVPPS
jgi:hypothetical protein